MTNKIIINKAKNGQPFVEVKGGNNETVAVTETYSSLSGAKKSAADLSRIITNAVIINKVKPSTKKTGK